MLPLLYNCRHFVELSLKDIIRNAQVLAGRSASTPLSHDLASLWSTARSLAEAESPSDPPDFYAPIDLAVAELSHHDPHSEAFRYPATTADAPSLPNLAAFDLDTFATNMGLAIDHLVGMQDYFYEGVQALYSQ